MCVSVPKDFFLGLISYTFYVTVSLLFLSLLSLFLSLYPALSSHTFQS